jgi:hypothetical protein
VNTIKETTLAELVRSFMEYAASRGIQSFPPMLYGPWWHTFLYEAREKIPEIAGIIGGFDWDCPNPQNRLFKNFGPTAIYSSFARTQTVDDRLIMNYVRPTNQLISSCLGIFEKMFSIANQIPDFFEIP